MNYSRYDMHTQWLRLELLHLYAVDDPPPASWQQTVRYGLLHSGSLSERETQSDVLSHPHGAACCRCKERKGLKIPHAIHVKVTLGATPNEGLFSTPLTLSCVCVWQVKLLFRVLSQPFSSVCAALHRVSRCSCRKHSTTCAYSKHWQRVHKFLTLNANTPTCMHIFSSLSRQSAPLPADSHKCTPALRVRGPREKKRWLLGPSGSMYGPLIWPVCLGQPQLISPWHEWTKQQINREKKKSSIVFKETPQIEAAQILSISKL